MIWKLDPLLLIPLLSWVFTTIHGIMTWIIVRYTMSKASIRRTVLDTSNIAVVTMLFMTSFVTSMGNLVLSVTINAGWIVSHLLGFVAFLAIFLYHSELLANAVVQACVINFPSTLYNPSFNNISKTIIKLGLPTAAVVSYALLEVYSGSKFFVTEQLMGQQAQPVLGDMWTQTLLFLSAASVLTTLSVRIFLYLLRRRLNLPAENNIISNLSIGYLCMINILHFGLVLFSRMTSQPGDTKIHINFFKTLVPVCIVCSSDSIWNYACELPLFRPIARHFRRRQLRRIAERHTESERMQTYNHTSKCVEGAIIDM